ncbi:MAG: fructose-bisphosphatase class II family protein [Acidobacteria bacterium]|nr:fructose-bisphosphatase class II family protein [Acidobacteriota bacterium]
MDHHPLRNMGFELARVTESTALSAARWVGLGTRQEVNGAAFATMYDALNMLEIDGVIAYGEEGRLGAPLSLQTGSRIGSGNGPAMDVLANPIDGAGYVVQSLPNAVSALAVLPRGSVWRPRPAVYMEKIVVDQDVAEALVPECLDAPAGWTIALVARKKKKPVRDVTVFVLDRPRHQHLVEEIRRSGARLFLRQQGDLTGALLAVSPQCRVDILMGIGGVAEGLLAACAVKSLGGGMLGRLAPQTTEERSALMERGIDPARILQGDEMISAEEIYAAVTGITDSPILAGVHFHGKRARTETMILRHETGMRRKLVTDYRL